MKKLELVEWKQEYETGIKEIDEQHRKLFLILNRLVEARRHLVSNYELEEIIHELLNYTQYHFSTEECLFKDLPIAKEHKKQHLQYTIAIMKYNIQFLEEKKNLDSNIIFFLIKWIKNHILKTDLETFKSLKPKLCTAKEGKNSMNFAAPKG